MGKYSIFDVIMPLPGTDVAYPGGTLGEKYREFLRVDGLDPENFTRKQRSGDAYNVRLVFAELKAAENTPYADHIELSSTSPKKCHGLS